MILATAVLAAVFYLTDHDQATAVKTEKTALTEKEVNSYLDDQQKSPSTEMTIKNCLILKKNR